MKEKEAHGDAVAVITDQRRLFLGLIRDAQSEFERGRSESAAGYSQIAAHFAWHNHPGLFASPSLEDLLTLLSEEVPPAIARGDGNDRCETVLHVFTTAFPVGGHTRLVWRWIQSDSSRRHSVVLTSQRGLRPTSSPQEVPPPLADAVAASGGELVVMNDRDEAVLTRAGTLRSVGASFDRVVLHTHPYDPVPLIAFGLGNRPPVIFVNHAEHVFWAGASVGDVVAHLRPESASHSEEFRGIERTRSFVLPVPLADRAAPPPREDAKQRLGVPPEAVVLLTIASPHKYRTRERPHFVEAVAPVLDACKDAVLVAVGPTGGEPWETAAADTGGRVLTFGYQKDVDLFFAAADVYLDSFPIGSLTSALDAALHGVPVVQCKLSTPTLLPTTDVALDGHLIREKLDTYAARIATLVEDEAARRSIGAATREGVLQVHTGEGWRSRLDELYAKAARTGRPPRTLAVEEGRRIEPVDEWVQWMNEMTGFDRDFSEAQLIVHTRFMSPAGRFRLAGRVRKLAKAIPPLDIRTRGHLERPRRYVAGDAVYPADWPVFLSAAVRAAAMQTRDLARTALRRRGSPA